MNVKLPGGLDKIIGSHSTIVPFLMSESNDHDNGIVVRWQCIALFEVLVFVRCERLLFSSASFECL